jgi:hypothetical protein
MNVSSTAAPDGGQKVNFTRFRYRLSQPQPGHLRIDGDADPWPQAFLMAKAGFDARVALLQGFDHLPNGLARNGDSFRTAGKFAQQRWKPHDSHYL